MNPGRTLLGGKPEHRRLGYWVRVVSLDYDPQGPGWERKESLRERTDVPGDSGGGGHRRLQTGKRTPMWWIEALGLSGVLPFKIYVYIYLLACDFSGSMHNLLVLALGTFSCGMWDLVP